MLKLLSAAVAELPAAEALRRGRGSGALSRGKFHHRTSLAGFPAWAKSREERVNGPSWFRNSSMFEC